MATLSFLNDPPFFDGDCVRFIGINGEKMSFAASPLLHSSIAIQACLTMARYRQRCLLPHLKNSWVTFTMRRGPSKVYLRLQS